MANFIKIFLTIFFLWSTSVMAQQNTSFPVYTNNDLGISWSNEIATLKIWAPLADSVLVEYFGHNLTIPIQFKALEKVIQGFGIPRLILIGELVIIVTWLKIKLDFFQLGLAL